MRARIEKLEADLDGGSMSSEERIILVQKELVLLREKELFLLRQGAAGCPPCRRACDVHGTACQPPAWVFSAGAPSPGPDKGTNRPGGLLLERSLTDSPPCCMCSFSLSLSLSLSLSAL